MALSKEDKLIIKEKLYSQFTGVYLIVDGYAVFAGLARHKMKLEIEVFVDGFCKCTDIIIGKKSEFDQNLTEIARRFYCVRRRCIFNQKQLKIMAKIERKKVDALEIDKSIYSAVPIFNSANAFITHLVKNNKSIEVVTKERHDELQAVKNAA